MVAMTMEVVARREEEMKKMASANLSGSATSFLLFSRF